MHSYKAAMSRTMPHRYACYKGHPPVILPPRLIRHAALHGARMPAAQSRAIDTISLTLDSSDPLLEDKREYLDKELQLTEPVEFELSPDVPPSRAMMGFLRLRGLKGMDALVLKPVNKDDLWDISREPGSEENERAVCERMAKELRNVISCHSSSTQAGGTLKPGSQEEAAVKAQLKDVHSLETTASWFEQRASRLPSLSYYKDRWQKRLLDRNPSDDGPEPNTKLMLQASNLISLTVTLGAIALGATAVDAKLRLVSLLVASLAIAAQMAFLQYVPKLRRSWSGPYILRRWLRVLVERKNNNEFHLFAKDTMRVSAHLLEVLSGEFRTSKAKASSSRATAVPLTCALIVLYLMGGEVGMFLDIVRIALGATVISVWTDFRSASAQAEYLEGEVRKRQLEVDLAKDAIEPSHPLPGPVKVGFLDTSLSLPVYRYIYKYCK